MLRRTLITYLRPYWRLVAGVLFFQFLSAMATLYLPSLNANIVDNGVALGDTAYIWRTGSLMLAISFGQITCSIIAMYLAAKAAMRLGRDIRNDVFHRVVGFSEREVTHFGAGSLITRNTNDVQQVQMLAMMTATFLVTAPMLALGGIIMALRQDVGLSWLIAVSVPVLLTIAIVIISRMVPLFRSFQGKLDTINRIMREQLTGIRVIRAFVREPVEKDRFNDANTDIMVVGRKIGSLFVLLFPLAMLVLNVTVVGVVWFGALEVDNGTVQIGTLFAFMQYIMTILMGVLMATFMTMMIPRAAVSAERINEVLATSSTVTRPDQGITEFPDRGAITLTDVEFAYPGADHPIVTNINVHVNKGETLAIVGSTGAGKTTLISLLPRLFDVTGGSVQLHGVDVRDADIDALWNTIGLVPKNPSSSPAQSPATFVLVATMPQTRNCGRHSRLHKLLTSFGRKTTNSTPTSPRGNQRVRRATSTSGHRPGDHSPTRHPHFRRLLLRARPHHRRQPTGRTMERSARCHQSGCCSTGLHHHPGRHHYRPG